MDLDDIARAVIGSAIRIHTKLGPGLFEHVYEAVLYRDLVRLGFKVERQKPVPIEFEQLIFDEGFRADLIVDGRLLVEIKSVPQLHPVHHKQTLTDLRLRISN